MDHGDAFREYLTYVISAFLEFPDQASLRVLNERPEHYLCEVVIAQSDVGRLIGRQGRTISAIRSLLKASARRHHVFVNLRVFVQEDGKRVA